MVAKDKIKRRIPLIVSSAVLILAVLIKIWQPTVVESIQLKFFDTLQSYLPREYTPQPVRIVDIDDESLARIGQWPWPRKRLATLVEQLHQAGAAAIAMDIVFAEPDRTSPQRLISTLPGGVSKNIAGILPDYDNLFAERIEQAPVITGFALTQDKREAAPQLKAGYAFVGGDPYSHVTSYQGVVKSLPILETVATGNGALNSVPDKDGVLRRMPLVYAIGNQLYPTLSAEALRVAQGASSYVVKSTGASDEEGFGTDSGITAIKIGVFEVPTDAAGQFWIHYTPYRAERYIPAWKIIDGDFDTSLVEGTIVLVGTSAAGLKDIRTTPLNPVSSGVEVHAQAIEQVLVNHYITRPDWIHGAETLWVLLAGGVLIVMMTKLPAFWGALYMMSGVGGALALSYYAFIYQGVLVEPVTPSIAVILLYFSESLSKYIGTEREKQQVRNAFGLYMSPALVEELAENPEKLTLGGETKELTVLFCDIRGFTTISEQFDAQGLIQFINRFLTPMTSIILEHKGTIDKYMGDAIMAFWNAPLNDPKHAQNACLSALQMMDALKILNEERQQVALAEGQQYIPINIGIGLNTGECCVGNMGSEQRFDYSILGDDVNLASRLEGQSKNYGVNIIIGEATRKSISELAILELDLIQVKGKTIPVKIYALLGDETIKNNLHFQSLRKDFNTFLQRYRAQEWTRAESLLETCKQHCKAMETINLDTLFLLYNERITHYRGRSLPANWDGVYEATTK